MGKLSYKTRCILFLLIITLFVFIAVKFILPYFLPFLFAYWLAKYSIPISFYLHKKVHIPKTISGLLVLSCILFVIGAILFLIGESLFQQINHLIENLPIYKQNAVIQISSLCNCCDNWLNLETGTCSNYLFSYTSSLLADNGSLVFPTFTRRTITLMFQTFHYFMQFGIVLISALFMIQDHETLQELYQSWFLHDDIHVILKKLSDTGITYMKMQCIIILVIAVQCTIGLYLSHSAYPLLLGIIIAVLDALPLFGSGTILVPWSVIKLFSHNIIGAAILMSTYLICQFTRQFLESKLLGNTLGLAPIYFVMSIFIGIEIFGISGVILGPFSVLFIRTIYQLYKPKPN